MTAHIGYIRVSSFSQNGDRQLHGLKLEKTFEEKASAKDLKRPVLKHCLEYLREGDVLHVHSIDRLARNLQDLQHLVDTLTGQGINIHFHKENLEFSGKASPMNKLMLQLLGAVSEFERSLINERRREGMAAARAKGKQIGAKRKLSKQDLKTIRSRLRKGATKKALAEEYGISRQTLYDSLRLSG